MTAGQFKREDMARSLLNRFVLELVQIVQLIADCHGLKRIFFGGGFASTPLVRSMITAEYVRRNLLKMTFGQVSYCSSLVVSSIQSFFVFYLVVFTINSVKCPSNVIHDSVTIISELLIIIIIIITAS